MPPPIVQSAAATSRRNTITPSHVSIQAATTTSPAPPSVSHTTWNAEDSSRTGFFMSERLSVAYATNYLADSRRRRDPRLVTGSEQVHGGPHDDPHHVDEVPVD